MRINRAIPLLLAAMAFAACGSSDKKTTPDAHVATIDATPVLPDAAPVANGLATVCTVNTDCPTGNMCTGILNFGSQTKGWCTPNCMAMDTICTTGYAGPAGGMPKCALTSTQGGAADGCLVLCTTDPQCATGMTCQALPAPNQAIKACAPPPP